MSLAANEHPYRYDEEQMKWVSAAASEAIEKAVNYLTPVPAPSVQDTLAEREVQYGSFANNAAAAQMIKEVFRGARGWAEAQDDVREALDVIATKISRILSTTHEKADSWHDIAGYATLIENRINKETK